MSGLRYSYQVRSVEGGHRVTCHMCGSGAYFDTYEEADEWGKKACRHHEQTAMSSWW